MRHPNQQFGRFLLNTFILLKICCTTTFSQLQRTSNSACGDIVCPGELIQYECVVGIDIDIVVWRVSGCDDTLEILYQQGMGVQQAERACGDGKNIMADLQQINASSLKSVLNITGVQSNLTVQCLSDDGLAESSIGTNALISTAPTPDILQWLYTSDSRIVVSWDPVLEGCSSLQYNFTQSSSTCGTCELADDNMVTCTDSTVGECSLAIQTFVCSVPMNESILTFNITPETPPPIMPTNVTTSGNNSPALGIVAVIIVEIIVVVAVVVSAYVVICCKTRHKQEFQCSSSELELSNGERQVSGSGEVKEMDTSLSNNATDAELGELKAVGSSTPKPSRKSSDPIELEVIVPPPPNTLTPANSNGGLRGEESEANAGDNIDDRNDIQRIESSDETSNRQSRSSGSKKEGCSGSVEIDQHAYNVIGGEQFGPANRDMKKMLSHISPGSYDSQPSGGENAGPGGDIDFPLAVEESSPPDVGVDSGSKEEDTIQKHQCAERVLPSSGIEHPQPSLPVTNSDNTETSQDNKQNHQCTELTLTLPSSGAIHQPSLTNTVTGITETSQGGCHLASSPGSSQFFNVTRRKKRFSAYNIESWEEPGDEASCHQPPVELSHGHESDHPSSEFSVTEQSSTSCSNH